MTLRPPIAAVVALTLAACSGGPGVRSSAATSGSGGGEATETKKLTVMTRNLYVGGDLFLPFVSPDPLLAASIVWGDILASDVPGRMKAIAGEIAGARADLVGLQEVYRFVVTPLGADAPVLLDLDFLALLEGALDSPGAWDGDLDDDDGVPGHGRYRVAASAPHTVLTVPFPAQGLQITMIDRDAILAGPGVHVLSTSGGDFAAELVTTLAGVVPVRQRRGWVEADVRRRDARLTFVNVHLETKTFGPLQSAQAQELLALLPAQGPLVVVGDFNSSPVDPPIPVGGTTAPTPYQLLTSALADAWTAAGTGPGLTCCFPADLRPPGELVERVDLVLFRGGVSARTAARVGTEPLAALDGRWPSDHAGVVAGLRVPEDEDEDDDGDDDPDDDGRPDLAGARPR